MFQNSALTSLGLCAKHALLVAARKHLNQHLAALLRHALPEALADADFEVMHLHLLLDQKDP
jgi:hypothetical protein